MKKIIWAIVYLSVSTSSFAVERIDAVLSGDSYLGFSGSETRISLGAVTCRIFSDGDIDKNNFQIAMKCGEITQVLWNTNQLVIDDISFDDPKFSISWAGDRDNDGKLDLIMDLSPKYSCTKNVTFLSALAKPGELVGIEGNPKYECC